MQENCFVVFKVLSLNSVNEDFTCKEQYLISQSPLAWGFRTKRTYFMRVQDKWVKLGKSWSYTWRFQKTEISFNF